MPKKFPTNPSHPERICWGCDLYCPAKALACGNGSERTQHPAELFGEDWNHDAKAPESQASEVPSFSCANNDKP